MKFKLLFIFICLGFIGSIYTLEETFIRYETPNEMLVRGAENGDMKLVQEALKKKADVNYKNIYGNTALMSAANLYMTKLLLNNGADPDIQNNNGYTALMFAASLSRETIVKLLLESGASLDLTNQYGQTALDIAKKEKYKSLEDLIKKEYEKREKFRQNVHKEITDKYLLPDLANIVLEYANYSKQKDPSNQLLLKGAQDNNIILVQKALQDGADVNYKDKNGLTALMLAQGDILKLLLKNGANLNIQNNQGYTALMLAVAFSQVDTTKLLLEAGAALYLTNQYGHTALDIAIEKENKSIVDLIEKKLS